MKPLLILLLTISINLHAQNMENLKIENLDVIALDGRQYLKLVFEGDKREFMEIDAAYTKVSVTMDGKDLAKAGISYTILKEYLLETDLKELPENKEIIVKVRELNAPEEKTVKLSYTAKPRFEITKIELIEKDKQHFMKLSIKNNGEFYSYPIMKITSNGKVVGERGLSTYGLVETELIPTTLEKLPADFSCSLELSSHGSFDKNYTIKYPAK